MVEKNDEACFAMVVCVGYIRGAKWLQHRGGNGVYVVGHIGKIKFTAIGKQASAAVNQPSGLMVMMQGNLVEDKEGLCCRCSSIKPITGINKLRVVSDDGSDQEISLPRISVESR